MFTLGTAVGFSRERIAATLGGSLPGIGGILVIVAAGGFRQVLVEGLDGSTVALLVLAIGAGSVFFSHVNDAGFWLVKEYFGMTVGQTIKSWSVMETIISVVGLVAVLILSIVV